MDEMSFQLQKKAVFYSVTFLRKEVAYFEALEKDGKLSDMAKPYLMELKQDLEKLEGFNDAWS